MRGSFESAGQELKLLTVILKNLDESSCDAYALQERIEYLEKRKIGEIIYLSTTQGFSPQYIEKLKKAS